MSGSRSEWRFLKQADEIEPLLLGRGACMASATILVDGASVTYAYREAPEFPADSGWRFFAGNETPEYCDNPDNFAYFDCNTVANYDKNIIALVDEPVGSAHHWDRALSKWVREELHAP